MLDRLASKYVGKNKPTEKLVLCVENNSRVFKNNIHYKKRKTDEKDHLEMISVQKRMNMVFSMVPHEEKPKIEQTSS